MKKLFYIGLLSLLNLFLISYSYSQISYGGYPLEIRHKSSELIPIIRMPKFNVVEEIEKEKELDGRYEYSKTFRFAKAFATHYTTINSGE